MRALPTWRLVALCLSLPLGYLGIAASLRLGAGYWLGLAIGCGVGLVPLTLALRGLPDPDEFMGEFLDEAEDYLRPTHDNREESVLGDPARPGPDRDR